MVEFRPVSWQPNDDLTMDKLNQMNQNDQYLFDNTANMVYRDVSRIRTTTGLKLIAGVASITPGPNSARTTTVSYAGEFNTGVSPIITTGCIITSGNEADSFIVVRGIGTTLPGDSGFLFGWKSVSGDSTKNQVSSTVYCHFMALGVSSRVSAAPQ